VIGPFYYSEVLGFVIGWVFGFGWGAMFIIFMVIVSAGRPSVAKDRNDLLAILSANGISSELGLKILTEGINAWSKWRWKTRPTLWRWGFDWPEYKDAIGIGEEFQRHYEKFIPPSPPSYAPSPMLPDEPDEAQLTGQMDTPADLPPASAPSEMPSSDLSEVGF
jgi:hypothetical protein